MSGGAGVLMADAAEEQGLDLAPLGPESQKEVLSWVPFAAPRNPVDVTAQALNDPTILDKSFDLLLGKEKFPSMVGFFTTWAFYDLRFDGTDTLATCLIEANDVVGLNPDQLDALKKLAASRMGVYEQVGTDGRRQHTVGTDCAGPRCRLPHACGA